MTTRGFLAVAALFPALLAACASGPKRAKPGLTQKGLASWYGADFHGRPTASGETYDMHRISAAHRTLPLGTTVKVKNLDNGRTLQVPITDRGPFVGGRILDLSRAAAEALGMLEAGLARVRITVLEGPAVADLRVQVGAFRDRANADRLARELRDLSGVVVASVGGLYRVQVPVRGNAKSPEALQKQLRRRGLDSVLVPAGSQPPRSKT